jgi:hypothetical protein
VKFTNQTEKTECAGWWKVVYHQALFKLAWFLWVSRGPGFDAHPDTFTAARRALKAGKIITRAGPKDLKPLNKTRPALRKETFGLLTAGRMLYVLDPDKKFAHPA